MVVNAVYFALLIGNALVILAGIWLGVRLLWVCRAAVLVSGIALIVMVVPLLNLLSAVGSPPEYRVAFRILLKFTFPILAEFLALLAVIRWRMHVR